MKVIQAKFHGPTLTKPAKVIARDGSGHTATVSYHSAVKDAYREAVVKLCRKMKWDGKLICGDSGNDYIFVFLPHDLMLASRGRRSSDVLDLSLTDDEINNFDKMAR